MYTPIAQRNNGTASTGYVPVAQRSATPAQPKINVVQAQPTQTISGVVQAKPTQAITGVVSAQPKQTISPTIITATGDPYRPTMKIPTPSETPESTTASLLPNTFQTVYKSPDQIAWEDKSKSDIVLDLIRSPIKDLIVTPGVRMGQVLNEFFPQAGMEDYVGAGSEQEIEIPGGFKVAPQKTGLSGVKQIAGQGIAAASWLYTPSKVVGVGRSILNDVAIQSIKDGVNITDKLVRDALWNTIKKSAAIGALNGSFSNLGTSLQEDKGWTDNAKDFVIGGVFGAVLGGAMGGTAAGVAISKNRISFVQKQLMQELIDRGLTPDHAQKMVSQGGYIGDILGSTSGEMTSKLPMPKSTQGKTLLNQESVVSKMEGSQSYKEVVSQPGAYVKERGFMTSLKEHPETEAIFKDVVDNYNPHVNKEDIATVRAMSIMEPEKFNVLVRSSSPGAESTIAKVMYLKDSIKLGNIAEAKSMASVLAKRGTELGQGVQAYRTLGTDFGDPAASMVFAERGIQKANEGIAPNFEGKLGNLENSFNKIHEDVVDQIIKETPEFKVPKISKLTTLEQKIAAREIPVAEELAARISPYMKAKKPNPIKDMLSTLYKLAKEQLPVKGKTPPRDAIELIGQALRDKEAYKTTWLQAQDIVRAKWKDNKEALSLLDKYFDKTLLSGETAHAALPVAQSQINTAVKQGLTGTDLAKIIREHYTIAEQTGKELTAKLVEKANIPAKEAIALTEKIQSRFNELVAARKESALKTIFSDRAVRNNKTFVQQIVELSNLGAFNKVQLRDKLAEKLGIISMSDDLAAKIIKQSEFIQQLPKDSKYEIFKQGQNLIKIISDETPTTKFEVFQNVINMPRALMSSFDLSFGLRQGLVTAYRHPIIFTKAFKSQFGMLSEKGFENAMDLIMKNPDFEIGQKAGLAFTDLGSKMGHREENFMSSYAERIPFIGKGVKLSARAYTGMANKLRMDVFTSLLNDAERIGLNPRTADYVAEDIAHLVNITTGRGGLGFAEKAAPVLNALIFSPRLATSRLTLMNPYFYYKATPFVRKEALKSMLAYASSTATILGLAKASGLEVGADPRSADFGKIKIGNTRIDIMGGFQQYIRMSSQLISGKYISSTTGKEYTLGEGYKPMTRWDILMRQFESKTSPLTSFVIDLAKGKDYNGENVLTPKGIGKEVLSRIVPMVAQDLVDLYKEDPYLLPLGLLNTVGFGVQTYAPKKTSTIGTGLPQLPKIGGGVPKLPKIKK